MEQFSPDPAQRDGLKVNLGVRAVMRLRDSDCGGCIVFLLCTGFAQIEE